MPTKVIMPQLGESVVEGTVSKWLKREGEAVKEYEPLIEVTTDKVDTEIPSPGAGVLLKVYVSEGTTVKAGTLLAYVGQPGEAVEGLLDTVPSRAGEQVGRGEMESRLSPAHPPTFSPATGVHPSPDLGFISPVVAKMAAEHGIDLAQVKGTGSGGRITKKDVLAFVETRGKAVPAKAAEVPPWEQPGTGELFRPTEEVFGAKGAALASAIPGAALPLNNMRRTIAEHMVRSKAVSPHVTTVMEADVSRVAAHRESQKAIFARDGVNLTFTAYFVVASVAALKAYPWVNSSWGQDKILLKKEINVGVAAATDDGLIVPVIKNADEKSLLKIAAELNDLARRARDKRLKPDEVQGGTFTITNHGVAGSLFATPIINQPQCAILGIGVIEKRVKVMDDAIAIRPLVYLSLTFDHRIIDGAIADYFLGKVKETLERWG